MYCSIELQIQEVQMYNKIAYNEYELSHLVPILLPLTLQSTLL